MTKKHFIALADAIRQQKVYKYYPNPAKETPCSI